jgi:hypothetical protein
MVHKLKGMGVVFLSSPLGRVGVGGICHYFPKLYFKLLVNNGILLTPHIQLFLNFILLGTSFYDL